MIIDPKTLKAIKALSDFYNRNENLLKLANEQKKIAHLAKLYHSEIGRMASLVTNLGKSYSMVNRPLLQNIQKTGETLQYLYNSMFNQEFLEKYAQMSNYVTFYSESLGSVLQTYNALGIQLQNSIASAIQPFLIVEERIKQIPWENFNLFFKNYQYISDRIQKNFQFLTANMTAFVDSIKIATVLPSKEILSSLNYTTNSFSKSVDFLYIVSVEDAKSEFNDIPLILDQKSSRLILDDQLEKLNPDLLIHLQGMRVAESSTNPDRSSHFAVSARKLLTQVLHNLAPDDEIRSWNTSSQLYHNNKPTRKARLAYITRTIESPEFNEYLKSDHKFSIDFIDLLNKLDHTIGITLNNLQLRALRLKLEHLIQYYLEIFE